VIVGVIGCVTAETGITIAACIAGWALSADAGAAVLRDCCDVIAACPPCSIVRCSISSCTCCNPTAASCGANRILLRLARSLESKRFHSGDQLASRDSEQLCGARLIVGAAFQRLGNPVALDLFDRVS